MKRTCVAIIAVLTLASPALAQPSDRTAVAFTAGVSTGEEQTGAALGGTVLVNVTQRLTVEANGTYLDRGSGADAVNVGASLLFNLFAVRARTAPYVVIGGSVHHATFDLSDARFLGNREIPYAAGSRVCAAPGIGAGAGPMPGWGVGHMACPSNMAGYLGIGDMPRFYGTRLGALEIPANGRWDDVSFTDPAVSFGGGVRLNLNDRLMIRPDLRALIILGDGDKHTVGVFVVNVGYRF
jgi:hypothetical protein